MYICAMMSMGENWKLTINTRITGAERAAVNNIVGGDCSQSINRNAEVVCNGKRKWNIDINIVIIYIYIIIKIKQTAKTTTKPTLVINIKLKYYIVVIIIILIIIIIIIIIIITVIILIFGTHFQYNTCIYCGVNHGLSH